MTTKPPTPVAPFTARMTFTTQEGPESYVESFPADTPAECADAYEQARFLLRTKGSLPTLGYGVYGADPTGPKGAILHLADVARWEDACAVRDALNRLESELQTAAGIESLQTPEPVDVYATITVSPAFWRSLVLGGATYTGGDGTGLFISRDDLEAWTYCEHDAEQRAVLRGLQVTGATLAFLVADL